MLIIMDGNSTEKQVEKVLMNIFAMGYKPHKIIGDQRIVIGITGNSNPIQGDRFRELPGVIECIAVTSPYKLAGREAKLEDTVINLGDVSLGGDKPVLIAGPCSVEDEKNVMEIAEIIASRGLKLFRAGAFKPRTSPYAFQGRGMEGIKLLQKVKDEFGLKIITEVLDTENLPGILEVADVIQIGARNMYNYSLLKAIGRAGAPILLKRGLSATFEEFILSAEYILNEGNFNVALCERGIRTYSDYSRNTLDLNIVPVIKKKSHLPVIVDPSHATGDRDYVLPMAAAALAAGADGLMVEVHQRPEEAWTDGAQSIDPEQLDILMYDMEILNQLSFSGVY
jgi:3-deoxy-7-phosphoheptulonate synthase